MKLHDLKSMSVDELWELHEEVAAKLAAKLTQEKALLEDRLKQLNRPIETNQDVGKSGRRSYPVVLPKFRNPEQPDEIVAQGVAAWRAGAAVLHVHARNPDGSNTMNPAIFSELHQRLCAETDAVVQLPWGLVSAERAPETVLPPKGPSRRSGSASLRSRRATRRR